MEQRQALSGFALSAVLLALALPIPTPDPEACSYPAESVAVGRHTAVVRCDRLGHSPEQIRGPARRLFGLPLDLNRADARTLETLPGIGSVRAQQIVAERLIRPFERVDDLLRVHGIGPKTLARIRLSLVARPSDEKPGLVDFLDCRSERCASILGE